ncbi:molybdate ABC transporter substrate-binding protein [Flaviflexus massiliensis]|uniref:molybdate ABC transporter substrate-binding protein n=1 Tax=Flaviflexus massiliensis TaxID=1522309 RepID=UPI0006D543CA|nr:molybdate ABC transporter substrate-binding protein [Flaviflexus massiliensis]
MKKLMSLGAVALLALTLAACSDDAEEEGTNGTETAATEESGGDAPHRDITVMIAASMCDLAETVETEVEDDLSIEVTTVCGGSSDLVAQIEAGADVDILITANQSTADQITEADRGTELDMIAINELVVVVPAGNPANITGFDESMNEADLVICAPQVPCGDVSLQLAEINGITLDPVSEESAVTDVLGKITSGQGDVGLVYRTDANSAGDAVEIFDIPNAADVPNNYPLVIIDSDKADETEQAWIDAFTTGDGAQRMEDAGFSRP